MEMPHYVRGWSKLFKPRLVAWTPKICDEAKKQNSQLSSNLRTIMMFNTLPREGIVGTRLRPAEKKRVKYPAPSQSSRRHRDYSGQCES